MSDHYFTSPKWLVYFFKFVDRVPLPNWLLFGLVVIGSAVAHHLVAWKEGFLRQGSFDFYLATIGVHFVLYFYYWDLLSKRANRELEIFYSHSKKSRQSNASEIYDFNSLSEKTSALVASIGSVGVLLIYAQVRFLVPMTEVIPLSGLLAMIFIGSLWTLAFVRLIRQAFLMRQMYADVQVDVFKPYRIYDLSRYGSFSSASLVLLFYGGNLLTNPSYIFIPLGILTQIFTFSIAAVVFLFPLLGINRKMRQAKEAILIQTGENLRIVYDQINSAAQKKDFSKLEKVQGALSSLLETKESVEKIPTWPWQSIALSNFVIPLLIPLIAFLIQLFLERQLGL